MIDYISAMKRYKKQKKKNPRKKKHVFLDLISWELTRMFAFT